MSTANSGFRTPRYVRGFTLIEILIALLIGIFLLGALLTIVQANRTVFGNQNKLSQLQDSERMAMTMITDVIRPSETRAAVAQALRNTLGKRESRPPKKHGTIPL